MTNAKNISVFLNSLELSNYKCFRNRHSFPFGESLQGGKILVSQCTVFLGDNGTGKTNILKTIANISPIAKQISDDVKSDEENKDEVTNIHADFAIALGNETLYDPNSIQKNTMYRPSVVERYSGEEYRVDASFACYRGEKKTVFKRLHSIVNRGPAVRAGDMVFGPSKAVIGYSGFSNSVEYDIDEFKYVTICAYGVNRFSDTQRNLDSSDNVGSLFYNDHPLINVEEWLLQLEMAKALSKSKGARDKIIMLKNILRESELFPGILDYSVDIDKNDNNSILFENSEGKFKLNELGYGYQCMFAWVFDFIKKMFDRYPDSKKPLEEPAILLIDEIDLHLHPKWQRTVIRDLCKMFPQTQFIITTHSPLVVQSIADVNLFVLTKGENSTVVKHYPNHTFQGWTVEEILSGVMELEDSIRSDKYQELMSRLNRALDDRDEERANRVFSELKTILHPSSITREMVQMQIEGMRDHD